MVNSTFYKLLLRLPFCCFMAFAANAQTFNIASYNIRYDEKQDIANVWFLALPNGNDQVS